jgi:hypothetical protein
LGLGFGLGFGLGRVFFGWALGKKGSFPVVLNTVVGLKKVKRGITLDFVKKRLTIKL